MISVAEPMNGGSRERGSVILRATNVSKTFAGRAVLRGVDLELHEGEVRALVGENGSGKSTLIKILSGFHAPDPGAKLEIRQQDVRLPIAPGQAQEIGLAFVHQDLGLLETGTVLENMRLTQHETRLGWRIPWRAERARVQAALERFGLEVRPDTLVASLREVDRARIAVLRALEQLRTVQHGVLVLDEATAYLPKDGLTQLFAAIREIAAEGFAVLFVTHRLEEVWEISDRVSVLRDGALVAEADVGAVSEAELIQHILGFSLDQLYPASHETRGRSAVQIKDVSGVLVQGVSLEIAKGEIVGATGLVGMGWEELPYVLFGAVRPAAGCVEIEGVRYELRGLTPHAALRAGIALLPGNRIRDGGVGQASARENMTLATLQSYFRHGVLRSRQELASVRGMMKLFQIVPCEPEQALATFSGGNQQKVLLAKWFATNPKMFLLHEPTQGVDIGARKQIFSLMRDAAERGTPMIIASSEYEDLTHLCDRVLVFRNGRVVSELRGSTLTHERILEQVFRGGVKGDGRIPIRTDSET